MEVDGLQDQAQPNYFNKQWDPTHETVTETRYGFETVSRERGSQGPILPYRVDVTLANSTPNHNILVGLTL